MGDTKSSVGRADQRWRDPRFVISLIAPFGALFTVGITIFLATLPYILYFTPKGGDGSASRKALIAGMFIIAFLAGLYYCVVFYQVFFIELRKKFIAWRVEYRNGEFTLRGYYFKQASFKETDVASVEQFQADPRWFSKHMGTMLTRNPRIRCNFNLKVTLKDGRVFYLPGELDRPGELDQGDELKVFLEQRTRVRDQTIEGDKA